jgi:hypothetical protein
MTESSYEPPTEPTPTYDPPVDPNPGRPDHAQPTMTTVGASPKMIAATAVSTLVGIVVALLNALQANPNLFGDLPTPVQSLILVVVPPLLTGFAAYTASPGSVVEKRN